MAGELVRVMQWQGRCFGRVWTAIDIFNILVLGSPIEWDQFSDTSSDPHTPAPLIKGLWYSHIGWFYICLIAYHSRFGSDELAKLLKNVGDLKKQWYYRFLHYTYIFHIVFLGAVRIVCSRRITFIVWGLGVRLVYVYHVTFQ
ncbi:putative acyl-CoA desaturase [Rosa chinensis]|uniref:Putative acyl-CoA desaturase n=1 Tax=Rosa chinensis TaxID=74649 RepID=A0A2P6S1H8_ROSCH|nr:putative acyl-CoA desaturase [Rosa chinensis]